MLSLHFSWFQPRIVHQWTNRVEKMTGSTLLISKSNRYGYDHGSSFSFIIFNLNGSPMSFGYDFITHGQASPVPAPVGLDEKKG